MYVDYDFYNSKYGGTLNKEAFIKYEPRAEAYIRYFLFSKAEMLDQACDVIGGHYAKKETQTAQCGSSSVVKSENIDGYSVSYAVEQVDGETEESYLRKKAYDAAYFYLLPLGVLNRKVGCCCDHECRCDYL